MEPLDPKLLETWTTASLVLHIAYYAAGKQRGDRDVVRDNAKLVAAELNARVPPRRSPE